MLQKYLRLALQPRSVYASWRVRLRKSGNIKAYVFIQWSCLIRSNLKVASSHYHSWGARWLSGRASVSRARGRRVRNLPPPCCVLSKTLFSSKVLVIPRKRWFRPDMTEKLLTGTLNLNTQKKKKKKKKKNIHDDFMCTIIICHHPDRLRI